MDKEQRSILKEVEMLKRLSNPNVVQFFGTAPASSDQVSRLLKSSSQTDDANQSVLLVIELARAARCSMTSTTRTRTTM